MDDAWRDAGIEREGLGGEKDPEDHMDATEARQSGSWCAGSSSGEENRLEDRLEGRGSATAAELLRLEGRRRSI